MCCPLVRVLGTRAMLSTCSLQQSAAMTSHHLCGTARSHYRLASLCLFVRVTQTSPFVRIHPPQSATTKTAGDIEGMGEGAAHRALRLTTVSPARVETRVTGRWRGHASRSWARTPLTRRTGHYRSLIRYRGSCASGTHIGWGPAPTVTQRREQTTLCIGRTDRCSAAHHRITGACGATRDWGMEGARRGSAV